MSHEAQHQSEDKKSDETGASINNEEQMSAGVHAAQVLPAGTVDPVYAAKAQALNDAIQTIGMGRYQVISSSLLQSEIPLRAYSALQSFALLSPHHYICCWAHHRSFIVALVHCGRLWVLCR